MYSINHFKQQNIREKASRAMGIQALFVRKLTQCKNNQSEQLHMLNYSLALLGIIMGSTLISLFFSHSWW